MTRRQQVEALRQQKSLEIADRVAGNIREAVKQEVEAQLKVIKDTMFDLIDRVLDLETNHPFVGKCLTCRRGLSSGKGLCSSCGVRTYHESNSVDRQQREEAPPISGDDEVVPESGFCGECPSSCDGPCDDAGG